MSEILAVWQTYWINIEKINAVAACWKRRIGKGHLIEE